MFNVNCDCTLQKWSQKKCLTVTCTFVCNREGATTRH